MKSFLIFALSAASLFAAAETKTVAHRGFWKAPNAAQNSIAALKAANDANLYGSECDIWITADGSLVVYHDHTIGEQKKRVDEVNYDEIKEFKLSNGELLPTFEQYLDIFAAECPNIKLIIELKVPADERKALALTQKTIALVNAKGVQNRVEYISFSLLICKELARLATNNSVQYLEGNKSPEEIKQLGISGIDYHYSVYQRNPTWIDDAKRLNITTNVWTVNTEPLMREFIDKGIDFITTDEPLLLKKTVSNE